VVEYLSLETPDLFKDGAEVVVEGKLAPSGDFHATNLLAKCPSKFEAKAREAAAGKQI
jgi:cytochrome c-type biogenesis protein CcmE